MWICCRRNFSGCRHCFLTSGFSEARTSFQDVTDRRAAYFLKMWRKVSLPSPRMAYCSVVCLLQVSGSLRILLLALCTPCLDLTGRQRLGSLHSGRDSVPREVAMSKSKLAITEESS